MKFLVASNVLLKQISAINGVVASNPIIPILENILVELTGDTLTLTASDLQTVMTTTLDVEGFENGSIALPARLEARHSIQQGHGRQFTARQHKVAQTDL